jgi:hypothetical protein
VNLQKGEHDTELAGGVRAVTPAKHLLPGIHRFGVRKPQTMEHAGDAGRSMEKMNSSTATFATE